MEGDDFTAGTEAFLSWLSEVGVRINPKMVIRDLRSEGRGRGVGEILTFLRIAHFVCSCGGLGILYSELLPA